MTKRSLFSQAFTYILLSLLLLVILLSSIFFFSIRRSVAMWNVNRGQRLENLILPRITQIYRESGDLEEVTIHHELSPFLTSNVFTYIFDEEKEPIYIYMQGGRIPLYDEQKVAKSLDRLDDRNRPLTAVVATGEVIGYLAADTLGFSHDVANRHFLQTIFTFILWGSVIALVVALIAAYGFSKILSRQAKVMVTGLKELTEGNRQVQFPAVHAEEMNAIADSARHLQDQLQQEEQIRRQWADDVAHDLRTPVSALKAQLEGLSDGIFQPSTKRLQALYREVERIDSLVQDLQELNRIESPELNLDRRETNLPHFFEQLSASMIGQNNLKDVLNFEYSLEKVHIDQHYFTRALSNVIQNAVVHGEKGGKIHIKVYRQAPFTVFDISNRGWIAPHHAKRVFDRLYRGSASRTEPGSGLGLPITRAVMRAHGGDAYIEQRKNRTHVLLTVQDPPVPPRPKNGSRSRE